MNESTTGVILPEDGIVNTEWAAEQLNRVNLFSQELLNYGKGEVFFMLKTSLDDKGYTQSIIDLEYTVETAEVYISYLQKRTVLEAIKTKYYVALSLSAAEYIPDSIEDATALIDVCIARFGKPTADNLKKAAETTGTLPKKMSNAAISVEANKKKELYKWLLEEHNMSEDDIHNASRINKEGSSEFLSKMVDAYDRLEDWSIIYKLIAEPIHKSNDSKALRFLADINDASVSILEFIESENAYYSLVELKETFENEIYPKLAFKSEED